MFLTITRFTCFDSPFPQSLLSHTLLQAYTNLLLNVLLEGCG